MKEYAKYCKIKIEDTKYQLNLTEGGVDTAHFLGRAFTIIRLIPPAIFSFVVLKNLFTFVLFNYYTPSDVSHLIAMGILTCGFSLPRTSMGNGLNAILKCYSLKKKRVKYYEEMRQLEQNKFNKKSKKIEKIEKIQSKITKDLIKYFEKKTKRFKSLSKHYYKIEKRKGYVDGLASFALDNLEMHQEEIDKMIFHNIGLFKKLCPDKEDFLMDRFEKRYNDIVNDEPYYDEFIYYATHDENNIKNDCIDKNEKSDYLQKLIKGLGLKNQNQLEDIKPTVLENSDETRKIERIEKQDKEDIKLNRIYDIEQEK